jgi:hypothetical protein
MRTTLLTKPVAAIPVACPGFSSTLLLAADYAVLEMQSDDAVFDLPERSESV